jgi:hypothetical protein
MIETQNAATAPTTAIHAGSSPYDPNDFVEILRRRNERAEEQERQNKLAETFNKIKFASASALLTREFPEQKFAIDGLLAEGVTIFAGRPKLGKSWCALGLAVAVATGGRALGSLPVSQGDVLYLALEDGERRLQKRLREMLGSNEVPARLAYATEFPRIDDGGLDALNCWLIKYPKTRLIVIDTLKRVRPHERKHGRIYDGDYDAVAPLSGLAIKYGVSIVVIHHTRKMDSNDPLDMISGSTGLTGGADGALVLTRSRGQKNATLHVVGRDFEDRELSLIWDADSFCWQTLGNTISGRAQKILGWLRDAGNAGLGRSEINRKNGGRSDGIDDALAELSGERLAASRTIPTQGRAQERWFTVPAGNTTDSDDNNVNDDKSDDDVIDDRSHVQSAPVSSDDLTSSNTSLSSNTSSVAQDNSQSSDLTGEQLERAAIMEFDGGLTRADAERSARQQ